MKLAEKTTVENDHYGISLETLQSIHEKSKIGVI